MPETSSTSEELVHVPLEEIVVRDGFNPRTHFDAAAVARMAATMRDRGVLQPLLVRRTDTAGQYELVDGERRYRAAREAELAEVPVIVTGRDEGDGADLLAALTANFHRADHTPVEEARAFSRLLEAGLTRKGISEQLQVSRELVRERLEILELPEELHIRVDDGTIPLGAVKTLAKLAKIHAGLPACALRRVLAEPADSWRQRVTWNDVVADPIGAVTTQYGDEDPALPDGVFEAFTHYPLAAFNLSERATKDLAALARLNSAYANRDQLSVTIDADMVEQAGALGAGRRSEHGHDALIIGQDVADQLVADLLHRRLADERARARRAREHAPASADPDGAPDEGVAAAAETEEQAAERRRAEREAERERRASAQAFNLELGIAVLKAFAKVRIDARVIKVLSAISFKDELTELAARGARYGFPGWPTEQTSPGGKPKTAYLERYQLAGKTNEFLAGAHSAQEIAGRSLALAVMAVLADEECVARSNRSMVSLHAYRPASYVVPGTQQHGLPWARDVVELIEELAIERLPEHLTAAVRERREREHAEREERETRERAADAAEQELRERLDTMTPDERLEALRAFTTEYDRHTERAHNLREHILNLNAAELPASPEGPSRDAAAADAEDIGMATS
jgi:ParB/RepB/Spo0J family partition protein